MEATEAPYVYVLDYLQKIVIDIEVLFYVGLKKECLNWSDRWGIHIGMFGPEKWGLCFSKLFIRHLGINRRK